MKMYSEVKARPDETQNGSTVANLHQRICYNRVQTVVEFREAKPHSCASTGIAVGCTACFGIVTFMTGTIHRFSRLGRRIWYKGPKISTLPYS